MELTSLNDEEADDGEVGDAADFMSVIRRAVRRCPRVSSSWCCCCCCSFLTKTNSFRFVFFRGVFNWSAALETLCAALVAHETIRPTIIQRQITTTACALFDYARSIQSVSKQ